ncbi:MAG: biopolymer transporter ExbD [Elusimicrobia bacterium]|nr:biopolymer transporter ExbD [Elusimicrobiota bacterium]
MAIGAGAKGEEPITAINVTPLVDVCLVLVIIFMTIAPFAMVVGIKVMESRAGAAKGKVAASQNVRVRLSISGELTVNGRQVNPQSLEPAIARALLKSKDRMVIVSADDGNHVGQVVSILDTAQQAGAAKLAILKNAAAPPRRRGKS